MNFVIETHKLSRIYKSYKKQEGFVGSLKGFFKREYVEKVALHEANLQIEPGQIIGLVGANGAGKTTLLKLLSGLINPTSGSAQVLGHTPWKREREYLKQISILLGQKNQLWWDISPSDSYQLLAKIYDLDANVAKKRVTELAKMLDCHEMLDIQLRRLSLGERMKMEIIGALLHNPKVIFLDEPTIGLDIVSQQKIRDFLEGYVKERNTTIMLTSHYMDDISTLAHKLLLISKGSIVYQGTVQEFVKQSNSQNINQQEADFEQIIHQFLQAESSHR